MKKFENPSINIIKFESENIATIASVPDPSNGTIDSTQLQLGVSSGNTFNLVF